MSTLSLNDVDCRREVMISRDEDIVAEGNRERHTSNAATSAFITPFIALGRRRNVLRHGNVPVQGV